jgi:alanine-glyoxylate transaminase/serine-glyoxylate transaminase/serine-pyruvate transaminase
LTLIATLGGCEAGMKLSGIELKSSGVTAALDYFANHTLEDAK